MPTALTAPASQRGFLAGAELLVIDRLIGERGLGLSRRVGRPRRPDRRRAGSAAVRLGLYEQAYGWTRLPSWNLARQRAIEALLESGFLLQRQ